MSQGGLIRVAQVRQTGYLSAANSRRLLPATPCCLLREPWTPTNSTRSSAPFLGTCLVLLSLNIAAGALFSPPKPAKPGYDIAVTEQPGQGGAPAGPAEPQEPIAKLLASADPGAGRNRRQEMRRLPYLRQRRAQQGRSQSLGRGRPPARVRSGLQLFGGDESQGRHLDDRRTQHLSAQSKSHGSRHHHGVCRGSARQRARRRHRVPEYALGQSRPAAEGGRGARFRGRRRGKTLVAPPRRTLVHAHHCDECNFASPLCHRAPGRTAALYRAASIREIIAATPGATREAHPPFPHPHCRSDRRRARLCRRFVRPPRWRKHPRPTRPGEHGLSLFGDLKYPAGLQAFRLRQSERAERRGGAPDRVRHVRQFQYRRGRGEGLARRRRSSSSTTR